MHDMHGIFSEMPGPKMVQLVAMHRLIDKGSAIKGLVVCNSWDVSAFEPAKLSCPALL